MDKQQARETAQGAENRGDGFKPETQGGLAKCRAKPLIRFGLHAGKAPASKMVCQHEQSATCSSSAVTPGDFRALAGDGQSASRQRYRRRRNALLTPIRAFAGETSGSGRGVLCWNGRSSPVWRVTLSRRNWNYLFVDEICWLWQVSCGRVLRATAAANVRTAVFSW